MSNKTKLIIGLLFLVQIGIFAWSRFDYEANKSPFEKRLDFYLEHRDTVTIVDFKKMNLNDLPKSVRKLKNVESINLSFNQFTEFPKVLYQLPKLKVINLGYNDLVAVRLRPIPSVTRLHLEFNNIQHIQGQSDFKNLRYLNLNQNELTFFPFFKSSQIMDTIILANNQISGLIDTKGGLIKKIGHLDLSSNHFENFNEILLVAENCKSLNMANNFWQNQKNYDYKVPSELFEIEFDYLDISNCIIYNLPLVYSSNIKKLDLGYNFFQVENLDGFQSLEHLNLNRLTLKNLNYSNPNLKELILTNVMIEGDLNLDIPNVERLMISTKRNIMENLPNLPNLKEIQVVYENEKDINREQLVAKYPNTTINYIPSEIY